MLNLYLQATLFKIACSAPVLLSTDASLACVIEQQVILIALHNSLSRTPLTIRFRCIHNILRPVNLACHLSLVHVHVNGDILSDSEALTMDSIVA